MFLSAARIPRKVFAMGRLTAEDVRRPNLACLHRKYPSSYYSGIPFWVWWVGVQRFCLIKDGHLPSERGKET